MVVLRMGEAKTEISTSWGTTATVTISEPIGVATLSYEFESNGGWHEFTPIPSPIQDGSQSPVDVMIEYLSAGIDEDTLEGLRALATRLDQSET